MNNNITASSYPVSAAGPQKSALLNQLEQAVALHADPLEAWASYKDIDNETMSELLGCPLSMYQQHVYASSRRSYSPLRAEHVLRFCLRAGIHPADLAPKQHNPEYACPPYIFRAIQNLSKTGLYREDRLYAEAALNLERQRYDRFCDTYPSVRDIFADVRGYVLNRGSDQMQYAAAMRAIKALDGDRSSARNLLQGCFARQVVAAPLSDPESHIEDYYTYVSAEVKFQATKLERALRDGRFARQELKEQIAFIFGKNNADIAINDAIKVMRFFQEETTAETSRRIETIRDRWLSQFSVNIDGLAELKSYKAIAQDMTPEQWVAGLAKSMFHISSQKERDSQLNELNSIAKRSNDELRVWMGHMEHPEFSFIQNLYVNHALEGRITPRHENVAVVMHRLMLR